MNAYKLLITAHKFKAVGLKAVSL